MNQNLRRAKAALTMASNHGESGTSEWRLIAEFARDILSRPPFSTRKKAPDKALREPTRKAAKEGRRAKHLNDTRVIRDVVERRADGRCDLCGGGIGKSWPAELHHLESGSGIRRQRQSVGNTMWVHPVCRRAWHADPERFRAAVLNWAARHSCPVPRRYR